MTQGDVYWYDFGDPTGAEPGYRRPVVVVQNDALNRSGIGTTVVCGVTTNLALGGLSSNVMLEAGEAGLPQPSVVNVTQIATVDKGRLRRRCGGLSRERLVEVLDGIRLVIEPESSPLVGPA